MIRADRSQHLEPGDSVALVIACAATAGAFLSVGFPWPFIATVLACAAFWRRPWLLAVAVVCLTSGLAARAQQGLAIEAGTYSGMVTAVRDGEILAGTPSVEVRAAHHHLRLVSADSEDEKKLVDVTAGDHLLVTGTVSPSTGSGGHDRVRHIAGRLRATNITQGPPPAWWWRISDRARSGIESLAAPLPRSERALFDGFVLGDASQQQQVEAADFQGAGLTHLLVVSGENVAFVLTLTGPFLRRVGYRPRLLATLVLLIAFALITRFEPSVLRAAAMAAVAATGSGLGRPAGTWRHLALAVTALVIADPFLVHSVGFGLSMGASIGIIALARPIEGVLPGPTLFRRMAAVTIAAQFGVAPLILGVFGTLPVATLPANVLAGPAAALVMIVGLPVLLTAHFAAPLAGALVWLPRLLLWWIGEVARLSAAFPLGMFGGGELVAAALALVAAIWAARHRKATWCRLLMCVALGACMVPGLRLAMKPHSADPVEGLSIVRTTATTVVVLTAKPPVADLLSGLSGAGVRHIDLLIVPHGDAADHVEVALVRHRCSVARVMVPVAAEGRWPGAIVATRGERRIEGDITIDVVLDHPVLSVDVFAADHTSAGR